MHITFISLFPDIFTSFLQTSLITKAQQNKLLSFSCINPRDFCLDKHRQVDDEIYGGGDGLLIKAEPVIQSVEQAIQNHPDQNFQIIFLTPSPTIFDQQIAHSYAQPSQHLILVCGRYEGIDQRFSDYFTKNHPDNFVRLSLGKFVTLGGEIPAMLVCEAIVRLLPGVISKANSRKDESYALDQNMSNLEYPQYTRPAIVRDMSVPEILLSGHHKNIANRRQEQSGEVER